MNKQTFLKSISILLFAITIFNTSSIQGQSCLSFDGNDVASIPAVANQSLGTGDFTFEAWINGLEGDVFHSTILSNRSGSIDSGFHFAIHSQWGDSQHKMLMLRYNGINWFHINNGAFDAKVLDGKCHHVAVSKADNKLTFFIDGKEIGSRIMSADLDISTNAPILIGNDLPSGSGFNGQISEVRMWKKGLSEDELLEGIENGIDSNDSDLIGYWEMKEGQGQTLTDLTNKYDAVLGSSDVLVETIDPSWGAECCTYTPVTGDCLTFDGSDEARIPVEVSQSLGTGDFAFEAWINGLEEDVFHSTILSNRSGGINTGFHFAIHSQWGDSEHKMLMLRYNGINWFHINNGEFDAKVLDGSCHHVAVSKANDVLTFFIDGKVIGSRVMSADLDISTNAPILIGNDEPSGSGFNGQISDVRIWKKGLTEDDILDGMENGVDTDDPDLIGYWEMKDGEGQTIADLTNKHDAILGFSEAWDESIDPTWGTECCTMTPVTGGCLTFDGSDEARIPVEVSQSLGTGDFAFEARINGLEDDVFHSTILSNRSGGINTGFHFAIHSQWGDSEHKMLMLRYNGINWFHINNGDFDAKVLDGSCHHVAVSKANDVLTFFIDGKVIGSRVMSADLDISTNAPILIGNDEPSGSGFNGHISDVRIWKKGLTEDDILDGMENGVDTDDPDLIGYWEMKDGEGQTIADLTNNHDAILGFSEASGESIDPTWGTECCTMTPVTGGCLTFDGSDEARIPIEVSQSLGKGDFAFEAWINGLEDDVFHSTILSNRSGGINTGFHFAIHSQWGDSEHKMLMLRYNGINWFHINNGDFDAKVLDGSCHHVAVSKANDVLTFFIDGKVIGSRVMSADLDISTNAPILIGNDEPSGSGFNGQISDVRIWKKGLTEDDILDGMENGVDTDDPDLIGYWEMKDGEGQTIADLTNNHDAVLGFSEASGESIDPTWGAECCTMTPETGECLTFDGNDEANIPVSVSQSLGTSDFTFEAWISGLESDVFHSTILSNRSGSINSGFHFAIHSQWGDSQHKMLMLRYNGINWFHINNGDFDAKVLDGDCHHVAVSKAGDKLAFFIDGMEIGSRILGSTVNISTNAPILIGNDEPSSSGFNGRISDVRIWKKGLSAEDIEEGMNNDINIDDPDLIGYWEMKDGSGQTLSDKKELNHAVLGTQSGTESSDPTWMANCCIPKSVSTEDIEESLDNVSITVFPNPSTGQFKVKLKGDYANETYQYTVYDVLGRMVSNGTLSDQIINLQDVESGQYWLRLTNEREVIGSVKLMIIN